MSEQTDIIVVLEGTRSWHTERALELADTDTRAAQRHWHQARLLTQQINRARVGKDAVA
jgi:hypothetical protein